MLSAWKKLIAKGVNEHNSPISNGGINGMPPGVHKLNKELQRKFARGVNYNMKIVIKGDNRVGKTSLFLRLKGYGFDEEYKPTESLNVTSIDWSYKATDDVVKIDLWEAIDTTSKKSVNFVDLKTENKTELSDNDSVTSVQGKQIIVENNNSQTQEPHHNSTTRVTTTNLKLQSNGNNTLDPIPESARQSLAELSENMDVYKGANAVLLVMDMTKLWTFKYIQSELVRVPKHIPILVVANFRDQGHHRTVSTEQVRAFIDGLRRDPCDAIVMYTEASMRNGFGLKLIEKFFNIAFLKLQEASLLKQIELNRQEFLTTREELQLLQESTNKEYEQYLELQTVKRRQQADALSPVNSGLKQLDECTREQIRNTSMSSDIIDKQTNATSIESDKKSSTPVVVGQNFVNDRLTSIVMGAKCPLPEVKSIQIGLNTQTDALKALDTDNQKERQTSEDSDDDEEIPHANPLVADYQSDIDSDDQLGT